MGCHASRDDGPNGTKLWRSLETGEAELCECRNDIAAAAAHGLDAMATFNSMPTCRTLESVRFTLQFNMPSTPSISSQTVSAERNAAPAHLADLPRQIGTN